MKVALVNSPMLWILLPGLVAVLLYFLRRWRRVTASVGVSIALALCLLAWRLPIGETVQVWRWSFKLSDTLLILGRRFVLDNASRPVLQVIYLVTAFWLGGVLVARAGQLAVPLGLGIVALLTAALAVDPFLYAALLIEMAALVSVPLLVSPGKPVGRGVLRYLTFQTLGMLFLLFTGWLVPGVEANPTNQVLVTRTVIFLGLGFSCLLAVVPFQTWLPMLAEEAHPYAAVLIFIMLPEMVALFGLSFLDHYAWLRQIPLVYGILRLVGVLMVVLSGMWAAFQSNLGRMLSYTVMAEIGYSLLTIVTPGGLPLHFALLLPRALGLGVWALALSVIQSRVNGLDFRQVRGMARQMPVAAVALIAGHFSLAGLPLLAAFPVRLAMWEILGEQYAWAAIWTLLGSAGLLVGGVRTLAVLLMAPDEQNWQVSESRLHILFLGIGVAALLIMGLFPQWSFPVLTELSLGLEYIRP
jgi:formate hydrogenlyase subunit 3/multisubunit Na+/H+ antiporter MnhD subunit